MRRRINKQHRNYLIMGLCSLLVVMTVGYAVFSTQLNITGTTSIASDFNIRITNVTSKNIVGNASNASAPTWDGLTASFATLLELPGDSITYDITVSNEGTIDATLDSINISDSNNPAIVFEQSGINEGSTLRASETAVLTIKVTYSNLVTSQPEDTDSDFTVTLDYSQIGGGSTPPVGGNSVSIGGNNVELVSSGDGLYEDTTRSGRYVYKGANPNNYITFNGEVWRIVAKEADGTYKIVRNGILENRAFDTRRYRDSGSNGAGGTYCANGSYGCNAWAATQNLVGSPVEFTNTTQTGTVLLDSTLNTYLNNDYYNSLSAEAQSQIVSHEWGVGATYTDASWEDGDEDPSEFVAEESAYTWIGKVALLSSSDVHLSVSNEELCGTDNKYNDNLETCAANNYLVISGEYWWLLSPNYNDSTGVNNVYSDGHIGNFNSASRERGVRPATYLTSNLTLIGSGTQSDPFVPVL